MTFNEFQDAGDENPIQVRRPKLLPVTSLLLSAGLLALIVLLALSY